MKYVLLAPLMICLALFVVWPIAELFIISLQRTDFIRSEFVGLANYARVIRDPVFLRAALNSLAYMGLMMLFTVGGALSIALLVMGESKRWHDVTRVLVYLPMLSAGLVIAQVWKWIFHIHGPINWLLGTNISWFAQGYTAIPAVSLIVSVSGIGGTCIVILASITSIDHSLYDAAKIDGASWWQIKLRIVLPLIMPTVAITMLMAAIAAPQIFENIYALAPFEHSATVGWRIYVEAFQMSRHGPGAAMSVYLMVVLFGMAWLKTRIERAQ